MQRFEVVTWLVVAGFILTLVAGPVHAQPVETLPPPVETVPPPAPPPPPPPPAPAPVQQPIVVPMPREMNSKDGSQENLSPSQKEGLIDDQRKGLRREDFIRSYRRSEGLTSRAAITSYDRATREYWEDRRRLADEQEKVAAAKRRHQQDREELEAARKRFKEASSHKLLELNELNQAVEKARREFESWRDRVGQSHPFPDQQRRYHQAQDRLNELEARHDELSKALKLGPGERAEAVKKAREEQAQARQALKSAKKSADESLENLRKAQKTEQTLSKRLDKWQKERAEAFGKWYKSSSRADQEAADTAKKLAPNLTKEQRASLDEAQDRHWKARAEAKKASAQADLVRAEFLKMFQEHLQLSQAVQDCHKEMETARSNLQQARKDHQQAQRLLETQERSLQAARQRQKKEAAEFRASGEKEHVERANQALLETTRLERLIPRQRQDVTRAQSRVTRAEQTLSKLKTSCRGKRLTLRSKEKALKTKRERLYEAETAEAVAHNGFRIRMQKLEQAVNQAREQSRINRIADQKARREAAKKAREQAETAHRQAQEKRTLAKLAAARKFFDYMEKHSAKVEKSPQLEQLEAVLNWLSDAAQDLGGHKHVENRAMRAPMSRPNASPATRTQIQGLVSKTQVAGLLTHMSVTVVYSALVAELGDKIESKGMRELEDYASRLAVMQLESSGADYLLIPKEKGTGIKLLIRIDGQIALWSWGPRTGLKRIGVKR